MEEGESVSLSLHYSCIIDVIFMFIHLSIPQ